MTSKIAHPKAMAVFVFAIIGPAHHAYALSHEELTQLQASISALCVEPDKKGTYLQLQGNGKIEANAGFNKILKVFGLDLGAEVTRGEWDGINQSLDHYKTDPRECAIQMMKTLLPIYNRADLEPTTSASFEDASMSFINQVESHDFQCMMNNVPCPHDSQKSVSTLNFQFGNAGLSAANEVKVEVFVDGNNQVFTKDIGRIAKDVMAKAIFPIQSRAAPMTAACIEYSETSGSRKWVLFGGQAADASGGVMTGLFHMVGFKKVDDGDGVLGDVGCHEKATSEVFK